MPSCRPDDFRGLGSYWPTHPGVTGCRTVNHVEVHAYVYFTCKMGLNGAEKTTWKCRSA